MYWVFTLPLVLLPAESPERTMRVYDVGFLTRPIPQYPARVWPHAGSLVLGQWGGIFSEDFLAPDLALDEAISFSEEAEEDVLIPRGRGISPDLLVSLISQNIAEDTWANERNTIEATERELVVTQTPAVHRAIEALLRTLRTRRTTMVSVDVAYVPAAAIGEAAGPTKPLLSSAEFDAVLERAGASAVRVSLTAANEQLIGGFSGQRTARLLDTEVNQTGVLPVVNPVVSNLPLGLSVEALPLAIEGTDWFRVTVTATKLRPAGEAGRRETFFADLEFLPLEESSVQTALFVQSGSAALAGSFRASDSDGTRREFALLVRVRPLSVGTDEVKRPPRTQEFELRAYDAVCLVEPLLSESPSITVDDVEELIRHNVDPNAWRDERAAIEASARFLYVTARAETHRSVKKFLDGLLERRARLAVLEIEELEGDMVRLVEIRRRASDGFALGKDWRELEAARALERTAHAVATGILGGRMAAAGYRSRGFVGDIETVSGGTGFALLEMPDTVTESAGAGFQLVATLRSMETPDLYHLHVRLDRCETDFENTAEVVVAAEIGRAELGPQAAAAAAAEDEDGSASPALPARSTVWLPFQVDLPRQENLYADVATIVPPDTPTILKIQPTARGRGRMVIATARIFSVLGEGR